MRCKDIGDTINGKPEMRPTHFKESGCVCGSHDYGVTLFSFLPASRFSHFLPQLFFYTYPGNKSLPVSHEISQQPYGQAHQDHTLGLSIHIFVRIAPESLGEHREHSRCPPGCVHPFQADSHFTKAFYLGPTAETPDNAPPTRSGRFRVHKYISNIVFYRLLGE